MKRTAFTVIGTIAALMVFLLVAQAASRTSSDRSRADQADAVSQATVQAGEQTTNQNTDQAAEQATVQPAGRRITVAEAQKIATDRVDGQIREIELESDDGLLRYEIELRGRDGFEYELEVDASTGQVLKFERYGSDGTGTSAGTSVGNSAGNSTGTAAAPAISAPATPAPAPQTPAARTAPPAPPADRRTIGMAAARNIALGLAPGTVREQELDEDDGRLVYEFEIKSKGREVEVEIDAHTGEVLKMEIDD
ncbi:PepSY domain-containing protein [Anaerotalea alkaliphila]|uniref:PepSY domain-containing protein n=1 Tax=Anaerotalea alkaliphila TaxID=2662126 RepID=A0A7X5HV70_9FIRM|nr:PepSY domain-containing protein [Anaerotalea alkaliphila]NDL67252.1 PepSY domain-containing protein [Anaerotalea alkaliphila]